MLSYWDREKTYDKQSYLTQNRYKSDLLHFILIDSNLNYAGAERESSL